MSGLTTITSTDHLSALVRHGSTLAALWREAELGSTISLYEQVEQVVAELFPLLISDENVTEGPLIKECVDKVRRKIEATLDDFIKLDPGHETNYRELSRIVKTTFGGRRESSASSSFPIASLSLPLPLPILPVDASSSHHDDDSLVNSTSNPLLLEEEFDFDSRFGELNDKEKTCLFFFSIFRDGRKIENKVYDNYWLLRSLFDINSSSLLKLEEEGYIVPIYKNKIDEFEHRRFRSYRVRASVCSKVFEKAMAEPNLFGNRIALLKEGCSVPVYPNGEKVESMLSINCLVNISERALDATSLKWLSKIESLRILELGGRHAVANHIVAEDTSFLQALSPGMLELSFRGISGIVELPVAVCKLKQLIKLDLRACHDLEYLPKEIGELMWLRILDLSQCYLLGHIPKALASMISLRVLKGFVINLDSDQQIGNLQNASSSCSFSDLCKLFHLKKLTVRTRRMNFPTTQDIQTLHKFKFLEHLGVTWVGNVSSIDAQGHIDPSLYKNDVERLELQAVPNELAASRMLSLFRTASKLCIRGGQLQDLGLIDFPEAHFSFKFQVIRLRYLPKLQLVWNDFIRLFPDLAALEIHECPNLTNFPCDEDGVWKHPYSIPTPSGFVRYF